MEVRMNADLPAFAEAVDEAFAQALEDGLPPLYPRQPRWAFEDRYAAKRCDENVGAAFAQRRSHAAFAHVKLLARQHRGKTQPPTRRLALTLIESGPAAVGTDLEDLFGRQNADLRGCLHERTREKQPAVLRSRRRGQRATGGAVLRPLRYDNALCLCMWGLVLLPRLFERRVVTTCAVVCGRLQERARRVYQIERVGI